MLQLIDPALGTIELRAKPFTVVSFNVGAPTVRPVRRVRALADGEVDDTRYTGARAVTVALRLNEDQCAGDSAQDHLDALLPFMAPRRRPTLRWTRPGSPSRVRETVVRPEPWDAPVDGPRHTPVLLQFVSPSGQVTSPDQQCQVIEPALDVETGREYDLAFNRDYPESQAVGDRIITQGGNEQAHWVATIFGPVTNPSLRINGVTVRFSYTVQAGQSIVIDTLENTMTVAGVLTDPVGQLSNFTQWYWQDLLLQPGQNVVRYAGDALAAGTVAQLCWRDTWMG